MSEFHPPEIGGCHKTGCLLCGEPLIYQTNPVLRICVICNGAYESNAVCANDHYVCDKCHSSEGLDFLGLLLNTAERDPIELYLRAVSLSGVHMHGPEHHYIVPCVLLAAYRNNGGQLDLAKAIDTAIKRGKQVPGGFCGFWGACGAAVGAGIYSSIIQSAPR